MAKNTVATPPAEVNDWWDDDSLRCHDVIIVNPPKSFKRKLGAIPAACELVKEYRESMGVKRAQDLVAKYNAAAVRRGWKTWAVLTVDQEAKAFLEACKKAQVNLTPDSGGMKEGLTLHGSWFGRGRCWFSIDLDCDHKVFTYDPSMDIRAMAIDSIESTLARIKAAITAEAKPKLKAKAPRKRRQRATA